MCVYPRNCLQKNLKAVYISNEDFFFTNKLEKIMQKQLKCRQIIKMNQFRVEDFCTASPVAIETLHNEKDQKCLVMLI